MAETESGETAPPTDVAPEAIESAETPEAPAGTESAEKASREAARYRTRLREAEGVISGMREEVDRLHRAEVERVAGAHPHWMTTPGDLWAVGIELSELRDDDGRLDAERVKQTIGTVLAAHPNWAKRPDMGTGYRGTRPVEREPSFAALLKTQRGGPMSR